MLLDDQVDRYLNTLVTERSPQTISWYRKRLKPLRTLDKNISSITLSDLQCLYAQLANQKTRWVDHPSGRAAQPGGLSPATLRGYVRAWRSFFNWLVDDNVLPRSPARKLKLPQVPKQPPKSISRDDMERIVEAARLSSARDYAIACILADSACRVGGLCAITLDNLDIELKQAFVTEKGQTRFLLFGDRTITAIRAYLIERPGVLERELFLGKRGPLKPGGVHALLDRLAKAARIDGRHNPHSFRHGWARAALRNGAELGEVAQFLGHQQVQTTFEFYGRWDNKELHDLRDRVSWLKAEDPAAVADLTPC
jgi:site-specific recombinase XerD